MRIRTIKPEFWESESLSRVSREARLLFVGLFSCCDDHGRTRAHSRILASRLYPFDDDALSLLEGWLSELQAIGSVRIYEVDGERFLDIPKWLNHQKIDRPSKSKFPEFDESSRVLAKCSLGTGNREQGREQGTGMQGGGNKAREWGPNPTQLRLGALFKRKPETRWSEKEIKAFRAIGEIPEADLALIESYHARSQFHRKDLQTLLNNWVTELDRARNFDPRPILGSKNGIPVGGVNHILINAENWEKQEERKEKVKAANDRMAQMSAELDAKMKALEEEP